jgi:hypothetical protein
MPFSVNKDKLVGQYSKIFCLITVMLSPGAVAIIAGLLAHQLVFIHGEWHQLPLEIA